MFWCMVACCCLSFFRLAVKVGVLPPPPSVIPKQYIANEHTHLLVRVSLYSQIFLSHLGSFDGTGVKLFTVSTSSSE